MTPLRRMMTACSTALLFVAATALAQEQPPPTDITPPPPPPAPAPPTDLAPPPPAPPVPAPAPAVAPAPAPVFDPTLQPALPPPVAEPAPEAAPAQQAPPPAPAAAKKGEDDDDYEGLFGPVRLGPIVGTGIPDLIHFGAVLKITRYIDGGIVYGHIPTVKLSLYGDAQINYNRFDVFGRIYPLGGAFFLGAGVGYKTVSGTLTDTVSIPSGVSLPGLPTKIDVMSQGSVHTLVLTPRLGLFKMWKVGFCLGLDAGVQVPIAPSDVSFSTQVPPSIPAPLVAQYVTPNDQKVSDTLQKVGRAVIPEVNIRIGWLL